MQNNLSSSQSNQGESGPLGSSSAMSAEALARRRALFKGLSRGSAALVMAVPISTLAAPTIIGGGKLCTVSGVQSNIGSHPTGGGVCSGYQPNHYQTLANWPGYIAGNNPPNTATATISTAVSGLTFSFTDSSSFRDVFGNGSTNVKLLKILIDTPTSNDAVWVTALLNAIKQPAGFNFPYNATQVRAFYTGGDPKALAFFKDFMQTVA